MAALAQVFFPGFVDSGAPNHPKSINPMVDDHPPPIRSATMDFSWRNPDECLTGQSVEFPPIGGILHQWEANNQTQIVLLTLW